MVLTSPFSNKGGPLVIPDGVRWFDFNPHDPSDAPRVPGVYCYKYGRLVAYVGSASDLRARLLQHASQPRKSAWMLCPDPAELTGKFRPSLKYGDWMMIEARLIRKLRPAFNWRGVDCPP